MTTLLIDGDGFAYRSAITAERATDWGDGLWTLHADANEALAAMDADINYWRDHLGASEVLVAITDQGANFRNSVWPTYKAKRKKQRRPMILPVLREHLLNHWNARLRPNLEADDVIGILATHPVIVPGDKIIVSADKDFFTIPGKFIRTTDENPEVVRVTEAEADRYHLLQTLTGDTTDEYPGCPGVGPKKADTILEKAHEAVSSEARQADPKALHRALWGAVVKTYEKAGLSEDDAIVQARCARILRATDYDFKRKEPILWTP